MTDPPADAWVMTRAQLIDAIANVKVHGRLLPGRLDPVVSADAMADAILGQLPAVTAARAALHRAISDPGSITKRGRREHGMEPLYMWQARAVEQAFDWA